jgi:hypothetical protein
MTIGLGMSLSCVALLIQLLLGAHRFNRGLTSSDPEHGDTPRAVDDQDVKPEGQPCAAQVGRDLVGVEVDQEPAHAVERAAR